MNRLLLLIVIIASGCGSLPEIKPGSLSSEACGFPFLTKEWRLVHTIIATMPTGDKSSVLGITVADPGSLVLKSAILTIEGLVVFNAEYYIKSGNKLVITRGIKPFDSIHFARGLMEDIRLIFFRPHAEVSRSGFLENGKPVCRFKTKSGNYIDVIKNKQFVYSIKRYSDGGSLERTVTMSLVNKNGFMIPGRMELVAEGVFGYKMIMDLVRAEQVK